MRYDQSTAMARREVLVAGAALTALALLPRAALAAVATADPLKRLLHLSSNNAFAALSSTDGFWKSPVARINLPILFVRPGTAPKGALADPAFRDALQQRLNTMAQAGLPRAQAALARAITQLRPADPAALLRGATPTQATTALRQAAGPALINAMIPPLGRALRRAQDPTVAKAVAGLRGVDLGDVAHALANGADNAIWYQLGAEEAAIRRDPASAGDAALAAALAGR